MSKISILCPTRNRPEGINSLVTSAKETAHEFSDLEFVFYIDEDDKVSIPAIEQLNLNNIKYVVGSRIVLSQMWNECYYISSGDILMHCGDDILFRSENWDKEIKNAFDKYDDKIVLVYGNDLAHGRNLSTHGFFHRKWVEAVGYFCPPYFSSDWNDVWLFELGRNLGRLHYLPNVITEHMHPSLGKGVFDDNHKERMERGSKDDVTGMYNSIEMVTKRREDIMKLQKKINNDQSVL